MKTEHLPWDCPQAQEQDYTKRLDHHGLQEPNRESNTGEELPWHVVISFFLSHLQ